LPLVGRGQRDKRRLYQSDDFRSSEAADQVNATSSDVEKKEGPDRAYHTAKGPLSRIQAFTPSAQRTSDTPKKREGGGGAIFRPSNISIRPLRNNRPKIPKTPWEVSDKETFPFSRSENARSGDSGSSTDNRVTEGRTPAPKGKKDE